MSDINFIEVNKYIDELRSSGATWQEVCDLCNERYSKEYGEAKWRKPYQAWRLTVDDVLNDESNELLESELRKIARAKNRLEINRKVMNAQKYELHQLENKEMLREFFNDQVMDGLREMSPKLNKINIKESREVNHVFAVGDMHYDGNANLDDVFSEIYNYIAREQKDKGFREITLAELGDLIDGATLRPSQLMALKRGMIKQASVVAKYYIVLLNTLTRDLDINVRFVCVTSSNHTQVRAFGSGRGEMPMEDIMQLIADQIEIGTEYNQRVEIIRGNRIITEINGIGYLFEHGDAITNPDKHIGTVEHHESASVQYAYVGHRHHYDSRDVSFNGDTGVLKNITSISHSDVCYDEYAEGKMLSSAPSIHYSIDGKHEKLHQRNLILRDSLEKERKRKMEEDSRNLDPEIRKKVLTK